MGRGEKPSSRPLSETMNIANKTALSGLGAAFFMRYRPKPPAEPHPRGQRLVAPAQYGVEQQQPDHAAKKCASLEREAS